MTDAYIYLSTLSNLLPGSSRYYPIMRTLGRYTKLSFGGLVSFFADGTISLKLDNSELATGLT